MNNLLKVLPIRSETRKDLYFYTKSIWILFKISYPSHKERKLRIYEWKERNKPVITYKWYDYGRKSERNYILMFRI